MVWLWGQKSDFNAWFLHDIFKMSFQYFVRIWNFHQSINRNYAKEVLMSWLIVIMKLLSIRLQIIDINNRSTSIFLALIWTLYVCSKSLWALYSTSLNHILAQLGPLGLTGISLDWIWIISIPWLDPAFVQSPWINCGLCLESDKTLFWLRMTVFTQSRFTLAPIWSESGIHLNSSRPYW